MPTCRVCLKVVKKLRYDTGRAAICGRCLSMLNTRPEVAEGAQQRLGEMLRRGIIRRATAELDATDAWRQVRAKRELDRTDAVLAQKLPGWVNRLLADPKNTGRDFKLLRAYRRHLLHFDRPHGWGYPSNWAEVAARIRGLDGFKCTTCGSDDRILDVHHIVYVYHFGTHRQENLTTLCRPCHEAEHGRLLDFGERIGSDCAPNGAAVYPDPEAATAEEPGATANDADSTQPTLAPLNPAVVHQESRAIAATPTPAVSAWCILVCQHCKRSQRQLVDDDHSAIVCVFCRGTFYPGPLGRLRRADW